VKDIHHRPVLWQHLGDKIFDVISSRRCHKGLEQMRADAAALQIIANGKSDFR